MELRTAIGIDLGKKTKHRAAIAEPGQRLSSIRPKTIHTSRESLDRLVDQAGREPCDVVLEPTGMTWFLVSAYLLIVHGCRVFRVDTRRVSDFRKVIRRDVKTDSVDAVAMARLPSANPDGLDPLVLPEALQFALDRACRQRAQFVEDQTRLVQRLEAAVETYIPGFFDAVRGLGPGQRAILREFVDPARMDEAGEEGLAAVASQAGCKDGNKLARRVINATRGSASLWKAIRETGCCPVDFDEAQREIARHLDALEDQERRIDDLDEHIQTLSRRLDPHRVLETIPGIGPVIAPALLGEFWNIERFPSAKKFVAYCGLVPKKNQTGQTDRRGQRITKAGKKRTRHYLYLAGDVGRQWDLQLAHIYQRKKQKNKHHVEATVAVAGAVARRVYSVLKRAKNGDCRGYVRRNDDGVEQNGAQAREAIKARYSRTDCNEPTERPVGRLPQHDDGAARRRPNGSAAGHPDTSNPKPHSMTTNSHSGPRLVGDVLDALNPELTRQNHRQAP